MGKNRILNIIMFISALVFIIVTGKIFFIHQEYNKGEESYQTISEKVKPQITLDEQSTTQTENKSTTGEATEVAKENPHIIDFNALLQINKEAVGWIRMNNTAIDYPIAKTKDNEFYLTHTFDGKENGCGSIFVDKDCEQPFRQFLTILYGHHMRNGSMFSDLKKYKDKTFAEVNKVISIETEDGCQRFTVFAANVSKDKEIFLYQEINSNEDKEAFLNEVKKKSLYWTNENISSENEIVALVTCDYSKKDGRMILYAVKESE